MQIDYTETHLPDDEVQEDMARRKAAADAEGEKEAKRIKKARNHTWKGGMV